MTVSCFHKSISTNFQGCAENYFLSFGIFFEVSRYNIVDYDTDVFMSDFLIQRGLCSSTSSSKPLKLEVSSERSTKSDLPFFSSTFQLIAPERGLATYNVQ